MGKLFQSGQSQKLETRNGATGDSHHVVIHELADLSVPNHSSAFWALVEEFCPERKHHQRWLRDNGDRLAGALRFST